MKRIALAHLIAAGLTEAANELGTPLTIHVVVKWKGDSGLQQQQDSFDAIENTVADARSLKNTRTKTIETQLAGYRTSFAVEFETKAACEAYTNIAAHKTRENLDLPYREEGNTRDIAN